MVASRSRLFFSLSRLRLDRSLALSLAVAGNALMLLLLSLPREGLSPILRAPPEPAPPILAELLRRAPPAVPQPVPPTPQAPSRPISLRSPTPPVAVSQPILPLPVDPPGVDSVQLVSAVMPISGALSAPGVEDGADSGVGLRHAPLPPYPGLSLRRGHEGTVLLGVLVSRAGHALDVRIERSSGHRELDRAAQQQVLKRWKFQPAERHGQPVDAWARVPVDFVIDR